MDRSIYLGFAVLELFEFLMYETYYDKLQPFFGPENIQLQYMDTDSFVSSMKTENFIRDIENLEDIFDFSNIDKNHELFSNKNEKVMGNFEKQFPKNICIDEVVCLRSEAYSIKGGDDIKNKLKGISETQTKSKKLKEYKKCLYRKEYQRDCNNRILRSANHEMYLQEVKKLTISVFDDKRCCLNETESKPWK